MINGINVIGRLHVPCGITIAARAVVRALLAGGIDVCVYNIEGEVDGRGRDPLPEGIRYVDALDALPYAHTLFLCHPNEAAKVLEAGEIVLHRHHTATILYWELENLPLAWHAVLRRMDTIFAPSTLVQRAVRTSLGIHAPYIPVVPVTHFSRAVPRLENRPFTFHVSFDLMSSFARKNPMSAVSAFVNAFPVRDDVRFLAKVWESTDCYLDHEALAKIEAAYPHVRFIFDDLSYTQTVQMIADADAYVSLHRSEGLGLGMLEAMSAGRPVIATNYGANTDYLNAENGMPVPFTLEPVDAPERTYRPEALAVQNYWATADSTDASLMMRALHADPVLYERLSRNARNTYEQRKAAFFGLEWLSGFSVSARPALAAAGV